MHLKKNGKYSWPVQHHQQKILALWLVFPRQSTWPQIVTSSLHFKSMVTHQPSYWLQISWLQNSIGCKWPQTMAWSAFWKLKGFQLSISAKVKLLYTTCVTIFLYGWEFWVLSLDMESKISTFTTSCYRIMLGTKWQDCLSNIAIYSMTNTEPLVYYVSKSKL